MGIVLSEVLKARGFKNVLGTQEYMGPDGKKTLVERGTPNTWDSNNGVTVVYDEKGEPWICYGSISFDDQSTEVRRMLKRGAYVPHSNDGGYFVRSVLPGL